MTVTTINSVAQFVATLLDDNKSKHTVTNYTRTLNDFERWLNENNGSFENLTRLDLKQYVHHLQDVKGNSPTTVKNKVACLASYCRYIERPELLEGISAPTVRKTLHVAPKSLERNDRNKLLREAERKGNTRDIAIVYMLLHTGLRVGELVSLNLSDITLGERSGSVLVRNGKGNVSRKVPLSKEVRFHLQRYLNESPCCSREGDLLQPLFMSNYKQRISVRAVQHMLKLFGINPHALRHTFCRELVANGIDIATVAELAGHSDLNVTRRYAMPSEDDLAKAIENVFN